MKKHNYYLVYINGDDSGNDDGVLDTKQMTDSEANELNQSLYADRNNCKHWIKPRRVSEPTPSLTHID